MAETDWDGLWRYSSVLAGFPLSSRNGALMMELPAQSTVFARDDRPEAIFFVLSGQVRLVRRSRSGREIVLQRTRHGFLAEASLFQPTYDCEAITTEASRLLSIRRTEFVDALEVGGLRDNWIAHLARELQKVRARAEGLSLKTAPERIVHYIESIGQAGVLHLNQTKKDWAADLGLTHEALYRALAQMKKRGQLAVDDNRLIVMGGKNRKASTRRTK
ncbi:CRP-like cAMP-binding protein [Bradyrhizobium japonicum]|uniref:Crp/Fnr family transcriptional regulator n=1 Tax=Bradyrhizobium japonicum TaxID=375 RepID=UPI002169A489|nr:Crp/Fnr family transcriptional regulator [Bradyrhizobium japonicum]MCS3498291.1 CRP-like cAMP-binding protein [Bradyrhizobium japonicum]MCS3959548.1 CRP-like cAMP-binding protein [Bradyrhizobium japonicum]MCS4001302.1 CRP-like cAMP-binding protein [Bradyrhizobium japonicum]